VFCKVEGKKILFNREQKVSFDEILGCFNTYNGDIVYLAGSLIEGFVDELSKGMGNPHSDMDIFILRDYKWFKQTEAEFTNDVEKTTFCIINGLSLHITVLDKNYMYALINTIPSIQIEKNCKISVTSDAGIAKLHEYSSINTLLSRTRYSICIHNEKDYSSMQMQIDFKAFLEKKYLFLTNLIDSRSVDVIGNLHVNEADAALQAFREMLLAFMEAVLAKEGAFVDRSKWVALKFANLARSNSKYKNIHKIYMDVFRGYLLDKDDCIKKIAQYLSCLEKELEMVFIDGFED